MQQGNIVVAQICQSLGFGGLERVVLDLSRGLDRARFRPLVVSLSVEVGRLHQFADAGVPVHIIPQQGLDASLPRRLARLFRDEAVDVVHAHNYGRFFYAGPAARLAEAPVALYTEHSNTRPAERALWATQRQFSRLADRVVTVSEAVRANLIAAQRLPAEQVRVIPNGIDLGEYRGVADQGAVRAELGLPADALVIGTVGRMVTVKNHPLLLEAFARVAADWPQARLLLVGDGPERVANATLVQRLGLGHLVCFAGLRGDVGRMLAAMDLFCLSSDSEGLPLGIIEAMAAGLPVVSTRAGGAVELVAEGQTGYLAPVGDATALATGLARLAADPGLRAQFGQTAAAVAEREYSLATMVDRYAAVYDELLAAASEAST